MIGKVARQWGFVVGVILFAAAPAFADCGSIPYFSPFEDPGRFFEGVGDLVNGVRAPSVTDDVKFDPLDVVVYEPGQRAIILWNGREETLLLSTEIKTSENVSILEVIPLPSEPSVRLGEFETFEKMERLVLEKKMWSVAAQGGVRDVDVSGAATITFHEQMGAHDVAVVRVLKPGQFVAWVQEFLARKQAVNPRIDPEFVTIIENYLDRGFTWFVFDTLQAGDEIQSRQPVEYRFTTDAVFYPLEISSRETGKTTIDLTVVTREKLTKYPRVRFASTAGDGAQLTTAELDDVSLGWGSFMGAGPVTVGRIRIKGNIRKLTTDFVAW